MVNIVFGTGPRVGEALVSHPEVPVISFTGSQPTAERITQLSAPHCKKLSLELGGKNPAIIFEDANLEECVPTTVRSSFANQVCPWGLLFAFLTPWSCQAGSASLQCKALGEKVNAGLFQGKENRCTVLFHRLSAQYQGQSVALEGHSFCSASLSSFLSYTTFIKYQPWTM